MDPYAAPGGARLIQFLDGLPVETRWPNDVHVMWRTGQINGQLNEGPAAKSHCSAFVGTDNFRRTRMSKAFQHHPSAWPDMIQLFASDLTDLDADMVD